MSEKPFFLYVSRLLIGWERLASRLTIKDDA
jgi:hypothetical protein